ncbi:MAG: TIGR02680 family protein, partial [Opitutales bacterium]|nr:TIGR02680 family protein [Opitutales bacterium]
TNAALLEEHNRWIPRTSSADEPALSSDPDTTRKNLATVVQQREEAIQLIEAKNQELTQASDRHQRASEEWSRAIDSLEQARSEVRAAEMAFNKAAEDQLEAYRQWRRETTELKPPEAEVLLEKWDAWLENIDGLSPLTFALDESLRTHTREITTARNALDTRHREHSQTIAEHRDEIERLESGTQKPPEPLPTRPADRTGRPGAPFWQTCDFTEHLPEEHRAGLEAALQASGVLDAWVLPDGQLVDPETLDAFLPTAPGEDTEGPAEDSLAQWLQPALNPDDPGAAALDEETIANILRRLGTRESGSPYWFSCDGTYQLGPLRGRWTKEDPEYIGESSRAAARKRRIATLQQEIVENEKALATIEADLQRLGEREALAQKEAAAAPTDDAVRECGFTRRSAHQQVVALTEKEAEVRRDAEAAAQAEKVAKEERDRTAADLRLSEWVDQLSKLRKYLGEYQTALAALWPTLSSWNRDQSIAAQAFTRAQQLATDLTEKREHLTEVRKEAAAARQKYQTLEATSGKAAQEILAQVSETEMSIKEKETTLNNNEKQLNVELVRKTQAEDAVAHESENQLRHSGFRQKAIDSFREFTAERLLADADPAFAEPDLEEHFSAVSRAVELARRTERKLSAVEASDEQWNRRQKTIYNQIENLRDNLVPHGHSPETRLLDDLVIIRVPFRGQRYSVSELHEAFATEISDRGRLLDEREREVIENHLLSETATEIQGLLRAAETWVAETNRELESRPTSTGMRLRFKWEPDPEGPTGLPAARAQLHQRAEMWNEEQRAGLAQFFQQLIEAERTANPSASWPELLGTALDYRRWHRFFIEREQNKQWKRLTRRTHGTGSGGEKALALTLPQFAAAAAHYRSASPHAPRLILLDEVFVGIDSEMRANCMELLAQFDLDFIMTSEREWGCYPALPALSICQLSTRPGFNAVGVTRWLWNGREKRRG